MKTKEYIRKILRITLFFLICNNFTYAQTPLNCIQGPPVTFPAKLTAAGQTCYDPLLHYFPIGNAQANVKINFWFLRPTSGTGIWDNVTQSDAITIINFFNSIYSNISQPTQPMSSYFYPDTKIRFQLGTFNQPQTIDYDQMVSTSNVITNSISQNNPDALNII